MKRFVFLLILFASISNSKFYPQGVGALGFTRIQQSHLLFGAGQIGTAIPNNDVLGYYLNPAILGYSAIENHASISFMPDKTIWGKFNERKSTFHNYGINLGYNFLTSSLKIPVSIGLGYMNSKFDFGNVAVFSDMNTEHTRTLNSYDQFCAFSIGIGIDYYIQLNLGLSLKSYKSVIGGIITNDKLNKFSAEGSIFDYGFLMRVPISELINSDEEFYSIDNGIKYSPIMNFSIGYSKNNIGDEMYYFDEAQKDPLSRTARLGYSAEFGLDFQIEDVKLNFLNYSFTAEAEDLLITPSEIKGFEYQDGIGDIDISENLIQLKSGENVKLHKGHIFRFFDTFILTTGRISGTNLASVQITNGVGITTDGLFRLIGSISRNKVIKFITSHFKIDYYDTDFNIDPDYIIQELETINTDGLSIHFRGFEI